MTARELAEKLLSLENPDLPCVLLLEKQGSAAEFTDPQGYIVKVDVDRVIPHCSLPVGEDQEILLLAPKGTLGGSEAAEPRSE